MSHSMYISFYGSTFCVSFYGRIFNSHSVTFYVSFYRLQSHFYISIGYTGLVQISKQKTNNSNTNMTSQPHSQIVRSNGIIDYETSVINKTVENIEAIRKEMKIKIQLCELKIHQSRMRIDQEQSMIKQIECKLKYEKLQKEMEIRLKQESTRLEDTSSKKISHHMNIIESKQSQINLESSEIKMKAMVKNALLKSKVSSLIPLLTVSKLFLEKHQLFENSIILSERVQVDATKFSHKTIYYYGEPMIGKHLREFDLSKGVDIKQIPGNMLLLLVNLTEWKEDGKFPHHIVPYSLSQGVGEDSYAILMVGSCVPDVDCQKMLWNKVFVEGVEGNFNDNGGRTSVHFMTVGKFFGIGTIPKYSIDKSGKSYGPVAKKKKYSVYHRSMVVYQVNTEMSIFCDQLNSVVRGIVTGGQAICQALDEITKDL